MGETTSSATVRGMASSLHFYPDGAGYSLKAALAKHHDVGADEICLGNGSNELIDLLARTFPTPDDHIVFGTPSFVPPEPPQPRGERRGLRQAHGGELDRRLEGRRRGA